MMMQQSIDLFPDNLQSLTSPPSPQDPSATFSLFAPCFVPYHADSSLKSFALTFEGVCKHIDSYSKFSAKMLLKRDNRMHHFITDKILGPSLDNSRLCGAGGGSGFFLTCKDFF